MKILKGILVVALTVGIYFGVVAITGEGIGRTDPSVNMSPYLGNYVVFGAPVFIALVGGYIVYRIVF